jgi:hypothetical protein
MLRNPAAVRVEQIVTRLARHLREIDDTDHVGMPDVGAMLVERSRAAATRLGLTLRSIITRGCAGTL